MQTKYLFQESSSHKSRYYMRSKTIIGEIKVTKKADPELMKKNKDVIKKWNTEAEKNRRRMFNSGSLRKRK